MQPAAILRAKVNKRANEEGVDSEETKLSLIYL
jgi:hypothetical protein